MNFPYSNYSELAPSPPFPFYGVVPTPSEPDFPEHPFADDHSAPPPLLYPPPLRFGDMSGFPASCPLPSQACMADDMDTLAPVIWESQQEHDAFLNASLLPNYPQDDLAFSPTAFSPGHHISYSSTSSYTRMFRGRKSKAASEAMDELRPYACDICQAAFARSHDRDRHKRSHTGETPYRCHGCNTGFKRPDARKRHWERDPACAHEDWLRVRHTPEGAKRRARAKAKPYKKQL